MLSLTQLGWNSYFEEAFHPYREQGYTSGRIAVEHRGGYTLFTSTGELQAEAAGRLRYTTDNKAGLPKVGDWVVITCFEEDYKAVIHHVLPRKTKFSRKVAGRHTQEQVIASNIDIIFIVQSMNDDFSIGRLERSLIMVHEGGAIPIIVLNKQDLCQSPEKYVVKTGTHFSDTRVLSISAKTGHGIAEMQGFINSGETCAFIGSSGVGKTTLINCLLGEDKLRTTSIREKDAKGRHTTARRELFLLPQGGMVIDTPGMRELALWDSEEGLQDTFSDINELGEFCHFSNCTHLHEIKCAIRDAVEAGKIPQDRYESYMKYQQELSELDEKRRQQSLLEKKRQEKLIHKAAKDFYKKNPKYKK